ncbi:MAG: hypothetical protein IJX05_06115 [Clostridia bacterium]|nr:hypothetical protein [Clostridia bacterium]
MKTLLLLQAVILLALPSVEYSFIGESVPFYVYDGVDFTCLFYLPETYFVAVEEEGDEFDRVTYLDLSGYVRHGSTEKVDYEPVTKYATGGSVTLKHGIASVYLYSDENCSSVLCPVTASDTLFLYGKANNNGVYYCRLKGTAGTMRGYVGSEGVSIVLPDENVIQAVDPPASDNPSTQPPISSDSPYASNLSLPVVIILIVSLALPAFLLVFLLTGRKAKDESRR